MADSDQTGVLLLISLLGVLLLGVVAIIWYIEPFSSLLDLNQKINVYLGFVIGIFAIIEAISTYLQWAQSKIDNKIEDLRNEIENVYGVLLTMVYTKVITAKFGGVGEEKDYAIFNDDEFQEFVNMLLKYSYVIPPSFLNELKGKVEEWEFQSQLWIPKDYYFKIYEKYTSS